MSRRLLSTVATGALLLGLAACGDPNPGAVTTPPPDIGIDAPSDGGGKSSDGGDEPTAEAPDIPPPDPADYEGMDQNTPEGAEQAFRYYIAVSIWAHQTGDDSALERLEGEDCGGCDVLNDDVTPIRENGLYWSELTRFDTGTAIHESSTFDHEIGYVFTLESHKRPNEDFTESILVSDVEYVTIGGMDWEGEVWIVNGMTINWGDDIYEG
ncbi:DUF6318 family protein [Brachybacterium saurashtrense]|uniref:DUF6318 domain-containing protein n=1 Tax=Brachybacterium saurashtrense TaxID=556288 RepID=A0A345YLE2_9MICO|nr:DUF6318 family protein [Brachybacterium saurashtrense]AXK44744.1 hypothetical protein DWV08_03280 [Brachybacterium saurashtrense]RRR23356.1 hypothetical protein DXU92_08415 [Brachybacterium saurashtrense]